MCKKLGRKFIGIEKNATYIKEAKKRILRVKKIKPTKIKILNKKIAKKIDIGNML